MFLKLILLKKLDVKAPNKKEDSEYKRVQAA
jgi:hypothetical protein